MVFCLIILMDLAGMRSREDENFLGGFLVKKGLLSFVSFLILSFLFSTPPAEANVQVSYSLHDLGSGRWKATYKIDNLDELLGIEWFTVYYDYGLYDSLQVETPEPLSNQWDQYVCDPQLIDPLLIRGLYDIQALSEGILPGQSLAGFSISFGWLGEGMPVADQYFEIYDDQVNLLRIGYATYIPEPGTLLLFAVGTFLISQRKSQRD